ncbi:MAG: HAMP domain-containing protein [Bacteroidales bacterium]|nr:HAMP domain-containing protein [Bacteroidales bacterium]
MSIKWKFIIWGFFFYLSIGFLLLQLLEYNKWYFLTGEVLLAGSLILFVMLYRQLVKPVETISSAANLLKEKDFNTRLSFVGQKEIDQLIEVYNKMSEQLHEERVKHEEKNLFLDRLIDASPSAILILGGDKTISRMNPAARHIFNLKGVDESNLEFGELPDPWSNQLSELKEAEPEVIHLDGIRRYRASCNSFMDKGFSRPFILIEEMTHELIVAERQSYEKVIRMMSHEVNNSVGAVNSVMQSVLAMSDQFNENIQQDVTNALQVSIDRNTSLNRFMANFADVVKLPQPNMQITDLALIIRKVVELFQPELSSKNIHFELNMDKLDLLADPVQMEQVLVNVIKNSLEAIKSDGIIKIIQNNMPMSISIVDNGSGITPEVATKLFSPFYSTKKTGQGIGLTLVREILMNHNFSFRLQTLNNGLTEFVIRF